ncbi:MAG TPA: hypothetical protein VMH33_11300 [Solirubrobacterales bacterium]|nr:hypothetical protein [Solirubrobacterales bacterium]
MDTGRKLIVGEALGDVFALYRRHFGVLIPIAFWLFLAVSVLAGIAGTSFGLTLVVGVLALAVGTLYQGMVVRLVDETHSGRGASSIGELIASVGPVLTTLVAAGLVAAAGIVLGLAFFIVPGCILMTIWAVIAPVVVIERRALTDAFDRSRELVRNFGWPVFGTVISAKLIAALVTIVLVELGGAIADGPILRIVLVALAATFAAPIEGLVAAVLYYRLLVLKNEAPASVLE